MSNRHEKEKGVNVQVLLRCRPFSDDELRNNAPQVVTCNDFQREVSVSQNIAGKCIDRVFTFDKVFGPNSKQKDLYDQAIIPIVNEVLEGFNCTIFAYGQTGTGKTYTMEGECKKSKSGPKGELPPEAGVIPRAVQQIFDILESQNAEYSVKVTFLELYNEEITDLLAPEDISKVALEERQKKQLPLMEDGKGGVLVKGLEEEIVASASEIFTLIERGSAKRRTAETLLNKQSSRSHSLFSITIHIKEATPEGEELIKCGKLNLVDLAGSENISRSGAREGRAREAGEINKSLLTLGRVINALVEHLGHIPYRDSKLTRLLRDSLGGRTKTCIIATVSPAVHCLEETLSTLDYAHRAKNIKNKPEVNQKMMKTTLIKDLYGEIERLKAEVYAQREKSGVYIPKERYYLEESERKAMADQIEQMGMAIENRQKQIEELQARYDDQVQQSCDLSTKLSATKEELNHTSKLLELSEANLKKCQYSLKERDFIISEQKRAENALAHQACVLRADLEKCEKDNASLFIKIAREDKLMANNRSTVNTFETDLAKQLGALCDSLSASVKQQNDHLQRVDNLCGSFLQLHNKASSELKDKIKSSRALYASHLEAVQNVVRLHKADSNAALEKVACLASSNSQSIEDFLAAESAQANSLFNELQETLSSHQGEMAHLARELQKRFTSSIEHLENTSNAIHGFLDNILGETRKLESHAAEANNVQTRSITEFQKAYEEQSRTEAEKLLADMASLVSDSMQRQKAMVNEKLGNFMERATGNKLFFDGHVTKMDVIATDLKRKWEDSFVHYGRNFKDSADFSASKHCRMELLLQKCVTGADSALGWWRKTHESLNNMGKEHAASITSHVRDMSYSNELHVAEIGSSGEMIADDIRTNSEDVIKCFNDLSDSERASVAEIITTSETHSKRLKHLSENHNHQCANIEQHAIDIFQQNYMDYEPTGTTPVRTEPDIPSKGSIESLRALPMEALQEEFRENHSYESFFQAKETKQSPVAPRAPLSQIN